jgi:hypothetical protein
MSLDPSKISSVVRDIADAIRQQVTGHYVTDESVTIAVTKCPRRFESWEQGYLSQLKKDESNAALALNLNHPNQIPRFVLVKSEGDDGIKTEFCMPQSMHEARQVLAARASLGSAEQKAAVSQIAKSLADKAAAGETATEKLSIQCASQKDVDACLAADNTCAWSQAFQKCMRQEPFRDVKDDTQRRNVATELQLKWRGGQITTAEELKKFIDASSDKKTVSFAPAVTSS